MEPSESTALEAPELSSRKWKPRGSTEVAVVGQLQLSRRGQHKKKDLTGRRFGRLLVISESGRTKNRKITWLCACDCGNKTIVIGGDMLSGRQVSCGCQRNQASIINRRKARIHGLSFTPVASTRKGMIQRCYNPNDKSYRNYGGRGISACAAFRTTPASILALLGERPAGMSIDRINNNGHYSCGACQECEQRGWPMNVRWATPVQQGRNSRLNRMVEINGVSRCMAEWAEMAGVSKTVMRGRLKNGVSGTALLSSATKKSRK